MAAAAALVVHPAPAVVLTIWQPAVVLLSGRVAGVQETHLGVLAQAAMTQCMERLGMRTEGIGVTAEALLEGS